MLKAQGVSWIARNAIKLAPVTVNLNFFTSSDQLLHLDVEQLLPAGAKSEEPRILDGTIRTRVSSVFGPVLASSKLITLDEAAAISPFLANGWEPDSQLIYAYAKGDTSKSNGYEWESFQVFGFADLEVDEGMTERKYVVRLFFKSPSLKEPVEKRLVYDFHSLST